MHNELWDIIYQYFAAQAKIYHKFADLDFEQQMALLTQTEDAPVDPAVVGLNSLYVELCEILQQCKDNMNGLLDETQTQFVVSTLAIACDENVLTTQIAKMQMTQGSLDKYSRTTAELTLAASWPKLQREFASCTNGGEQFFDNIDLFLAQSNVYRFIIELSYFCLAQGFRGKHLARLETIDTYKDRCIAKLTHGDHFSATDDRHNHKKINKYGHALRNKNEPSA
jgi:hypothetical protein